MRSIAEHIERAAAQLAGALCVAALSGLVVACGNREEAIYQPACPNMPAYSERNQKATAAELRDAASKRLYPHLREKVVDGGNTRAQLRAAGCKETGEPRPPIGGPPAPALPGLVP